MSSRRSRVGGGALGAAQNRNNGMGNLNEWDAKIYGELEAADTSMQTIFATSIHQIAPDPTQPRRQIPSVIRQQWDGQNIQQLFAVWINQFAAERGMEYEAAGDLIFHKMQNKDTAESATEDAPKLKPGVAESSLMEVVQLAADIAERGLINPVSVVRMGGQSFRLETGERRWLAYHLLHLSFVDRDGQSQWMRIPAQEVTAASVWRQASENTARAQINAISKARQLALLLMDWYTQNESADFLPYSDFEHDRHFYAQVQDGELWKIPYGKAEMFLTAMNVKNAVQLRQYRRLLHLPDSVWTVADDYNLTQSWLEDRQRANLSENYFLAMALNEAAEMGYAVSNESVSALTHLDDESVTGVTHLDDAPADDDAPAFEPPTWEDEDMPEEAASIFGDDDGPEFTKEALTDAAPVPHVPPEDTARVIEQRQAAVEAEQRMKDEARRIEGLRIRVLKWAYERGKQLTTMWFSATQANAQDCTFMNELVGARLLDSRVRNNANPREACYRISKAGCEYIGLSVLDFAQIERDALRRPTPPPPVDPEAERERVENRIAGAVEEWTKDVQRAAGLLQRGKLALGHQRDRVFKALESLHKTLDTLEEDMLG